MPDVKAWNLHNLRIPLVENAFELVTIGAVVGRVRDMLEFFLGPIKDRFYASYFARLDADKAVCRDALERIRKERPNFTHILEGRRFSNPGHERAVTKVSFELVATQMSNLRKVRRFEGLADEVFAGCENRDAEAVTAALNRLEPMLERVCGD